MSEGGTARVALFATAAALLVGGASYFLLDRHRGEGRPEATPRRPTERAPAGGGWARARAGIVAEIRRLERAREIARARRDDPTQHAHTGPDRRDLRRLEDAGANAERVGRAFFAAFGRYERGELNRAIATALRRTSTPPLARELLAAPPRIPPGAARPPPAELGPLEFVAGESDPVRRRLRSGELVGEVDRGGRRSALAMELRHRRGGWRVAGLGR